MFRSFVILAVLLAQIVGGELVGPSVWPQPTAASYGVESVAISPKLAYVLSSGSVRKRRDVAEVPTLDKAFTRYEQLMFPHSVSEDNIPSSITTVRVDVTSLSEAYPQLDTDESYELSIPSVSEASGDIELRAATVYGALRGLETLSQLVFYDFSSDGGYLVWPATISDTPRYAHRGMLLDTARHFQGIPQLRRTIDALSYAKYNVLHWHAVDDQSFPLRSEAYPRLWEGSFSAQERYSRGDIADLVEYGRERGVRLMLEFDMPGHASSWCAGYPEICPSPTCLTPLNPASNETFPLIDGLIREFTSSADEGNVRNEALFPYELFHLGGDEVSYTCWQRSDEVQAWEADMDFDGTASERSEQTYEYFVDKVANITRAAGRTPVQWVEVYEHFGSKLDPATVVHVWKAKDTMNSVLQDGYRVILSDNDKWYLDHTTTSWREMYDNEPTAGLTDPDTAKNIIGGESCMWGETVDASDLDNTVWPRAAAVSERLWTSLDVISAEAEATNSVEDRLETFRCMLNARGIGAAPVKNRQARNAPPNPGSCYTQRRF